MKKKAIVLLSGGLDSTTCLAIAKSQGFDVYALSFEYGQKHNIELERAKQVALQMGVVEYRVFHLPIGELGGSALTDDAISVKDYQGSTEIPATYVPARNTIFLSIAIGWGEIIGTLDIFLGANVIDYSGYPDCRPEYIAAFETMANLATKAGVEGQRTKIHTPIIMMTKAEIIREGLRLGVDYGQTISCYRADEAGRSCGCCDSCVHRKKGFQEAGVGDPTVYRSLE